MEAVKEAIVDNLMMVHDPEIPINVVEFGLIYGCEIVPLEQEKKKVVIRMTLTAPGCPVAGEMPLWVEAAVREVTGVEDVRVNMVFDPPWTPDRMSEEAKLELGWL